MDAATHPTAALPLVPQDAASLILLERRGTHARVLMGRRHPGLAFMPDKYVFPGGRVDAADATCNRHGTLATGVTEKLMLGMGGTPCSARAHALATAAVRETQEETGLVLGGPQNPALPVLCYFARAITPPDRPRRYDTRFFIADAALAGNSALAGDGELIDLAWFTLDEAIALDLPGITRRIFDDLAPWIASDPAPAVRAIPYYHYSDGRFQRDLL